MSGLLRGIGASATKWADRLHPRNASGSNLTKMYLASHLRRVPELVEHDIAMLSFRSSSPYTVGQAAYLGRLVFGLMAAFFIGEAIGRGMWVERWCLD